MSAYVPTVEERLRSSLIVCDTLTHCTMLADEHALVRIPPFTPLAILKLFPLVLAALRQQLAAITAALTADGLNLPAPAQGGAL